MAKPKHHMHYAFCQVCRRPRLVVPLKDGTKVIRTHHEAQVSVPLHVRSTLPRCIGSGRFVTTEELRCV